LSIYLDTSVFVPLFVREQGSPAAQQLWRGALSPLLISAWTLTEFASAIAMKARLGAISSAQYAQAKQEAVAALGAAAFIASPVTGADFEQASDLLDRGVAPLRAGDALHLAICMRLGCDLATFDGAMAAAAVAHGLKLTV
jgi:predicted nucleic acid-binding protein